MGEQENKEINEKVMRFIVEGKYNTAMGLQSATALPYRLVDNALRRLKCSHEICFDKKLGVWKKYAPVNREEEKYIHIPTSKVMTGAELDKMERNLSSLSKSTENLPQLPPEMENEIEQAIDEEIKKEELPNGLKELPPESSPTVFEITTEPINQVIGEVVPVPESCSVCGDPVLSTGADCYDHSAVCVKCGEPTKFGQILCIICVAKEIPDTTPKIIEGGIFDNFNEELHTIADVEEAEKNPQTEIMD